MPSEAIKLGAAERVLPLERIAPEIRMLVTYPEHHRLRGSRANE